MDLNQYIKDVTRTESVVPEVFLNNPVLILVLHTFVAAGNILDQIKKNAFYGKEIDERMLVQYIIRLHSASVHIAEWQMQKQLDRLVGEELEEPKAKIKVDSRVFHSIIGIITEATELAEALLLKVENGVRLDHINVLEEFGDIGWYMGVGVDALGGDFEKVLSTNIEKLKARYPEKFSSENAIDRDLDTERQILSDGAS